MIEPDRGQKDLDLDDGNPPLKLWYTPGAVRLLCKAIGQEELPLGRILELLTQHMTPKTLPHYIWAGLLWHNRKAVVETIQERIDWCPRPLDQITFDVQVILYLGLTGKALVDTGGDDAKSPDPEAPAVSGRGKTPSDSPSAKSVIQ